MHRKSLYLGAYTSILETDNLHTNDPSLFQRIAEGDQAAFALLFRTYYTQAHQWACHYLHEEFWAEEIVQEVFVEIWEKRTKLEEIQNPAGWLYRAVWAKCMNRIRKNEVEQKAQYLLSQMLDHQPPDAYDPADRERLFTLLEQAIERLPAQRRAIYELRYKQGLGLQDIADQLQLSRNTVRNHLVLVVENIGKYLAQHGYTLTIEGLIFISFFFD